MKKNIVILLFIICLCVIFYLFGFYSSPQRKDILTKNTPVSIVDYPLIDITFDDDSEWLVVVRTGLFTDNEKYCISQNTKDLHMNKERLMISTFPVGRGTTPTGIVYVYQDGEIIKEVPFIDASFENDLINDAFTYMEKEDVEKLVNNPLPPAI